LIRGKFSALKSNSSKVRACICRSALAAVLFLFFFSPSYAKNLTLSWDPNEEPDLGGYIVYRNIGSPGPPYRYSSHLPEEDLANPLNPRVTLTGLQEETKYHIALTAYDTDGNESRYSDSVCVQIIDSAIEVCSSSFNSSSSFNNGSSFNSGSGGCFISAAEIKISMPIFGPFFSFQPYEIPFVMLFLTLITTTGSIFLKITFNAKGSGFKG
jgi:hypothetical protein